MVDFGWMRLCWFQVFSFSIFLWCNHIFFNHLLKFLFVFHSCVSFSFSRAFLYISLVVACASCLIRATIFSLFSATLLSFLDIYCSQACSRWKSQRKTLQSKYSISSCILAIESPRPNPQSCLHVSNYEYQSNWFNTIDLIQVYLHHTWKNWLYWIDWLASTVDSIATKCSHWLALPCCTYDSFSL